ncbi:MAG: polysaccharide biosynthesis/export family protein [Alphaproteobacteria bacterium]|nr:polysaccharide biosynthesis/export family protein [Alphaproteobacteria bacterium]
MIRKFKLTAILFTVIFLTSCTLLPGTDVYISSADRQLSNENPSITVEQIEFQKITPSNTTRTPPKRREPHRNPELEQQVKNYAYKVGSGDVLQVTVWEHPELLNLGAEGLPAIGFLIDSQGFIFYPYVGRLHVSGLSAQLIRSSLTEALSKYIENPQLSVTVTNFASQKIYLTGEISRPLPQTMGAQALTLLDAINQAGGVKPSADLNDIVVIRKGQRHHIDLYALEHYGDMRENILLQDGDQIHVASQKAKTAFVLGHVGRTISISISPEGTTLADAIGEARGVNESSGNASAIYVIRKSKLKGKVAKVFMLDLTNMAAIVLAGEFNLQNEDVVYIAKAPIVRWNEFLSITGPSVGFYNNTLSFLNSLGSDN